jgi:hypothetical protein
MEPGRKRRAPVELPELLICAKKCILHHVFGILFIATHTIRNPENGSAVSFDKGTKRKLIAVAGRLGRRFIAPFHPVGILDWQIPAAVSWSEQNQRSGAQAENCPECYLRRVRERFSFVLGAGFG